ncbi:MAG TPA: glycosyltransferase WbuB [Castellaniella sp.]|uniref:glycosyltransferase WbuB n=1 Tax=Castellaniella sp. TaxID=1955812 RepID=UPI002F105B28
MRFLLVSINHAPEPIGIGKYNGELARWLADQGHQVHVVTAQPYYPRWQIYPGFRAWRYSTQREATGITIYRCPLYIPKKPSTLRRIAHLLSFALSSLPRLLQQWAWKPEVVMVVVPTLFCAPQAALLARLSGALSIIHIQDFEVDALFGLEMAKGGLAHRTAALFERFVLQRFDRISTISPGMLRRAEDKGTPHSRLLYLPNWSEPGLFQDAERSPALLRRLGVDPSRRIILYAGNLGEKQGLDVIIDCARHFQGDPSIAFLIVGNGTGKARLQDLIERSRLNDITLAPLQESHDLPALLASADCHLVIQKPGVADAVMPSKLTNILAVGGNAVITADPGTSLGDLCANFPGIATQVTPGSASALIQGIRAALDLPRRNLIAQNYAREHLSKDKILHHFFSEILDGAILKH